MMEVIEYKPTMGEINLSEEMIAVLKQLPLEEQAEKFAIESSENESEYSYGQLEGEKDSSYLIKANKCRYTRKWIAKDGIIVGIVFSNWRNALEEKFLNEWCNTYFCIDEDGTGSTDVSVYCRLVWKG